MAIFNARAPTWVVYATFLATGVGLTLPGVTLPLLLTRWSMKDSDAGLLFFTFFLASMGGALLARGRLYWSIARGCSATALGAVLLATATHVAAFAAIAIYGCGMGITMTSVSLFQSRLQPRHRLAEMARLNMVWALGACLGPSIDLAGSARWGLTRVLIAAAMFFTVNSALAVVFLQHEEAIPARVVEPRRYLSTQVALLLLVTALATGIESAVGGWLSTYAKRSGQSLGQIVSAVTWFWAGVLLSRLLQSNLKIASVSERLLLIVNPWMIAAALTLAVAGRNAPTLIGAALLAGLGIGPMYPLTLARLLDRGEGGNAVFLAGGVGASLLPLFTGVVSSSTSSLRAGLGVPLAAAALMACLGLVLRKRQTT